MENTNITLHHNFWDHSVGRNPKLGGAQTRAHLFNNYWQEVSNFSINASDKVFSDIKLPPYSLDTLDQVQSQVRSAVGPH